MSKYAQAQFRQGRKYCKKSKKYLKQKLISVIRTNSEVKPNSKILETSSTEAETDKNTVKPNNTIAMKTENNIAEETKDIDKIDETHKKDLEKYLFNLKN